MFDTVKAYQLLCQYKKDGYYERAKFVRELIKTQYFFAPKSIIECELLLNGYFREKTIRLALSDLNYSLIKLRRRTDFSILDFPITQHTIIAFTDAEGK